MKEISVLLLLLPLLPLVILATEKVDINTAPIEELIKIKYIGEKRAEQLISLRPFCSVDELTRISGIAEKTLIAIKEQGLAWVDPNYCQQKSQTIRQQELYGQTESQSSGAEENTTAEKPTEKTKPITTYSDSVVISELLPSPEGPDDKEEWIELFNGNNFAVDLSGWKIQDTIGSVKIYIFPEGTIIEPMGFLVLSRPTTKITLNNDGDGLQLLQPDGKIIHEATFSKAPKGQSYNQTSSGWFWSPILTPGSTNIIPIQEKDKESTPNSEQTATIDINSAPLEDLVKIAHIGEKKAEELISLRPFYSLDELTKIRGIGRKAIEDIKKQGLAWVDPTLEPPGTDKNTESMAALAESIDPVNKRQISEPIIILLAALGIAVFSGATVLFLKIKTKSAADNHI